MSGGSTVAASFEGTTLLLLLPENAFPKRMNAMP
eukprot:CAMPEP_0184381818 /NCGR_PEP_ID=MMETSP0007-20130409/5823_1 /TAXON_ID=97485 /ORGANISM="Prymnesium parvum, Strain Texoma1" /LENGTH=33 /DNA_ID= /DNA_START= /DNA_END= /DNA_ORIENTATION=